LQDVRSNRIRKFLHCSARALVIDQDGKAEPITEFFDYARERG
jgi:hypothetical protein